MLSGRASLRCLNELDVLYQRRWQQRGCQCAEVICIEALLGLLLYLSELSDRFPDALLVKQAASQWLWCLELFTAELSRRRWGSPVSHPPYSPTSLWLLLEQITWPESWVSTLRFGHWLFTFFFSRCSGWWVYCICLVYAALWHMRALHID